MTRYRSVLNLILALIIPAQISLANNAVPVLIWGGAGSDSERHSINPFAITTRKGFESFLHEKLEDLPPVLFFEKHDLCVEDLTKHKQLLHWIVTGDSYYYFPAVEMAVNVIEDLPFFNATYAEYPDPESKVQLIYTPINNLDVVQEMYDTLKEISPNLTAILTGTVCSYGQWNRVKREVETDADTDTDGPFTVTKPQTFFYASELMQLRNPDKNIIKVPRNSSVEEIFNKTELTLKIQFTGEKEIMKHILNFKFENRTGYHSLKMVNYEYVSSDGTRISSHNLTTNANIVFASQFSYHCSQDTVFKENDSYVLTIKDFQVQLFSIANPERKARFSDAYDCIGFTTIPIWTGIFVTAILGLIMIWGLTMIMDIRTMDRFDDPKGKTITVSAQE